MKKILLTASFLILLLQACNKPNVSINDTDRDEIENSIDNCPEISNPEQEDNDNDGIGDACDDDDDNDGILDTEDNCPLTANSDQEDVDNDGIGDICDNVIDNDNDGFSNEDDNCPSVSNPDQLDTDNDGIGNVCDDDDDNDGVLDTEDNCPLTANPDQQDTDNDGIGDVCEEAEPTRTPCENGFAGTFPCNGYDFMANVSISDLTNNTTNSNGSSPDGSDVWGWVDSTTNKEYAIAATTNGVSFVDITDPLQPVVLGFLPTSTSSSAWRDVKIYNNFAFVVADNAGGHGMQVFDLTRLRNVTNAPQTFNADTVYNGVGSCHNIVINEQVGIAYLVGCRSTNGGGPIFIDISNPTNPVSLGQHTADGYSHDAQVVTYNGPDTDHTGKEIYIGSNENEILVLDVTNKSNPVTLSTLNYPQVAYAHQGWFTEDQRYFILGDELDEQQFGMNTRSIIFDLQDLDNPVLSSTYTGPTPAIDHNGYVQGNFFYIANYTAGMRVLDITNIGASSNAMTEIGFFDTYPQANNASFNGAWSVYPYFPSGNIIINDIQRGLFIVRKSGT